MNKGKTCKEAQAYYDKLHNTPIVKITAPEKNTYCDQFENFHSDIHDIWTKSLINSQYTNIELAPLPSFDKEIKDRNYEIDEKENVEGIKQQTVEKILTTKVTSTIRQIESLSSVSKPIQSNPFNCTISSNEVSKYDGLLSLSFSKFELKDPKQNEEYFGFLYLINTEKFEQISEQVYFSFKSGNLTFTQNENQVIYFPIISKSSNLGIACFLQKKTESSKCKQIFACNYSKLFSNELTLEFRGFSDDWSLMKNHETLQDLFKLDQAQPESSIKVFTQAEIKIGPYDSKIDYSYTWKRIGTSNLLALPLPALPNEPSPIISLYNLHLVLNNPPKNSLIYIRGVVTHKVISKFTEKTLVKGEPVIPNEFNRKEKDDEYFSSAFLTSNEITLPDSIRIYINQNFNPHTHLILYFMAHDLKKGKDSVYKICIIPLAHNSDNIPQLQKYILYDVKSVPSKYLENPKPPKKTYLQCSIHLPQIFFPTPSFRKIINSAGNIPEIPTIPLEIAKEILLPLTAKLLTIPTEDNITKMLEFFEKFDKNYLINTLRSWIYSKFDAPAYDLNAFAAKLKSLINSTVFYVEKDLATKRSDKENQEKKEKKDKKDKNKIDNIQINEASKTMPLLSKFIAILLEIIATMMIKRKNVEKDHTGIVKLFKDFTPLLILMHKTSKSRESTLSVSEKYGRFLFLVQNFFTAKELSGIVSQFILETNQVLDEKGKTSSDFLLMQLNILKSLLITPNFILGCSTLTKRLDVDVPISPYNQLLSLIFNMTSKIFDNNLVDENIQLFTSFCGVLSRFAPEIERIKDKEVVSHICNCLFPFINLISQYYTMLRSHWELQVSIIPFILLVLNSTPPKNIARFYHCLTSINQRNFIYFLRSMVTVVLQNNVTAKNVFFFQITNRILQFLIYIVEELGNSMEAIVDLLTTMLGKEQNPKNFENFYIFIIQAIQNHQCERKLINMLLTDINSPLHSKRCICTALLSQQILNDYKRNGDIVRSSIDMMDSLTAILLSIEPDNISVYKTFIDTIRAISPNHKDQRLEEMIDERMKAAMVIADVVYTQKTSTLPPEVRCHQTMRIADQYKHFPSMRLKWLQQVLSINNEAGDHVSEFVTQMHIVALISTVYNYRRNIGNTEELQYVEEDPPYHLSIVQPISYAYPLYKYKHSQDYLDFAFMPEVITETEIPFQDFKTGAFELISDFNFEMLMTEIEKACKICATANIHYSLRPLLSLQMRLYYIVRNFNGTADACQQVQIALNHVTVKTSTMTHDISLKFYLVERKTEKGLDRQVYCVDGKTPEQFIEMITTKERFGDDKLHVCLNHSEKCHEENDKDHVCVVQLEPTDNIPVDGEDPHCWSKFQSKIEPGSLKHSGKRINVVQIETTNPLPHYKMTTDVKTFEVVELNISKFVTDTAIRTAAMLDMLADNLEVWYETEESELWGVDTKNLFNNEFDEKMGIIRSIFGAGTENSALSLIKAFKELNSDEADKIVNDSIRPSIDRALKIFLRAKKDIDSLDKNLKDSFTSVNEFLKSFNVEPIPDNECYIGKHNSMSQRFKFENKYN
ncbi:hypothetical protein TRFO_06846 [Tritrichomonas foetus]|uniref:DOCKER Lobe A domain-containing protein n=1 Tax=Tritrichomonas foetus TaxID=1144522 RepID=A0A1J4JVI2_9EUKA|nr:hypothetical protein TRFO_06846 [Tritrichomonas foetus]|eukprot:OHT03167.1 hypothetical protein TRFO_06846 [Tritrichomonas foetus]